MGGRWGSRPPKRPPSAVAKLGGDRGALLTAKQRAAGRAVLMARARKRALNLAPTIAELRAAGCESLRDIAAGLDQRGIPTAKGGKWSATQVMRLLDGSRRPFRRKRRRYHFGG